MATKVRDSVLSSAHVRSEALKWIFNIKTDILWIVCSILRDFKYLIMYYTFIGHVIDNNSVKSLNSNVKTLLLKFKLSDRQTKNPSIA